MAVSTPIQPELTQGAILLSKIPTSEIVKRIGVKKARSVRLWKNGRIPSDLARFALESEFGIARGTWFIKAGEQARAAGRVLNSDELARAKTATQAIRQALERDDLTDSARALLTELGNDLARSIRATERPHWAPPLEK